MRERYLPAGVHMVETITWWLVDLLILDAATFWVAQVMAYAIVITASAVVSKALAPDIPGMQSIPNPGSRPQLAPAGDNKLPVVYGSAYVGGVITDLSITSDNQTLYFCIALSEVTNTEGGGSGDAFTFGEIYWGGRRCVFDATDQTKVIKLIDESTGEEDTAVDGNLRFYLYANGSNSISAKNNNTSATSLLSDPGLVYKWDGQKLMSNCAFAIVKISYNRDAGTTGLLQTKFEVINPRSAPGDCFLDFLQSERYGAAIPASQIDTGSLTELNTYSSEVINYTPYAGGTASLQRFRFDGVVDTQLNIMQSIQLMASSCDCLVRYNEIEAKWGVIVQSSTYTPVMDLNDSNMVSAISVSPMDISSSYNIIECKYPDGAEQDGFNSVSFDLAQIDPALMFNNEPVNKQSLSLYFVNNNVRVQLIANRLLKAAREDLQLSCKINYSGIQLEAGDIVTVTNQNYGWAAKPFRIIKVTEEFGDLGAIIASLMLTEFNGTIYDDIPITQFAPAPNTGLPAPTVFGTVYAPTIGAQYPASPIPSFYVNVTASSAGVIQYAEVWYSAYSAPTSSQLIFAGTTEVNPGGNPYAPGSAMPPVLLSTIPSGDWYLFTRMINQFGASAYSPASTVINWRPSTYQYAERYLNIAYADSITGDSGFSLNPRNRLYYGLFNSASVNASTNPADYKWYLADPSFGSNKYLVYCNRQNRKFSFDTDFAANAAGTAAFVPATTAAFDPTIWSALPDGINYIDLDLRTGQLISTGTTSIGTGEIAVYNNNQGQVVARLAQYLDFGGAYQQTASAATITVDIYGRVVGFQAPDDFYFTKQTFVATSGQTAFAVTRGAGYIIDQCWVLQNGLLLEESEYIDAASSVTLATGATTGDVITVASFKSSNSSTGVYASFTRNTATLVNAASYIASGFTLNSGFELLFLNGTVVNENDYDIIGQEIDNFPSLVTGTLTIIQWSPNNLTTPNGNPVNIIAYTQSGVTTYPFSYDVNAFNLYENGVMIRQSTDYSTATGTYTLTDTPTGSNIMQQQTFARTGAV